MYLGLGLSKAQIIYHVHTTHPQYVNKNKIYICKFFSVPICLTFLYTHTLAQVVTTSAPIIYICHCWYTIAIFYVKPKDLLLYYVVVKHSSTAPHSIHKLTAAGNKILGVVGRTRAPPPQRSAIVRECAYSVCWEYKGWCTITRKLSIYVVVVDFKGCERRMY